MSTDPVCHGSDRERQNSPAVSYTEEVIFPGLHRLIPDLCLSDCNRVMRWGLCWFSFSFPIFSKLPRFLSRPAALSLKSFVESQTCVWTRPSLTDRASNWDWWGLMVSLLLELLDDETSGKLQDKQPYQKQVKTSINYKQKKQQLRKPKYWHLNFFLWYHFFPITTQQQQLHCQLPACLSVASVSHGDTCGFYCSSVCRH